MVLYKDRNAATCIVIIFVIYKVIRLRVIWHALYFSILYKSLLYSCNQVSLITIRLNYVEPMLNLISIESNNIIISSTLCTKLREFK